MKKNLLVIIMMLLALSLNAQNEFQNPGFESWTGNKPNSWNSIEVPMLGSLCDISKSTIKNSGSYSVSIKAKKLLVPVSGFNFVPGLLTNATIDVNALMSLFQSGFNPQNLDINALINAFTNGVQMTKKPESVKGFYKWTPSDSLKDIFNISVAVLSSASGTRELIGGGTFVPFSTNDVKGELIPFSINIVYAKNSIPDELVFIAFSTSSQQDATNFGQLILDDLSIESSIGLEEIAKNKSSLLVYPNPNSGEFKINTTSKAEVSVYNQLGGEVISPMLYTPNQTLRLKDKGIYFVRVKDNNTYRTQKLIVK